MGHFLVVGFLATLQCNQRSESHAMAYRKSKDLFLHFIASNSNSAIFSLLALTRDPHWKIVPLHLSMPKWISHALGLLKCASACIGAIIILWSSQFCHFQVIYSEHVVMFKSHTFRFLPIIFTEKFK